MNDLFWGMLKYLILRQILIGDEAKKQWQRLREGYSKNKNQKKPSGSAAEPRPVKWEYFNLIDSFLAPFVKPRKYVNFCLLKILRT